MSEKRGKAAMFDEDSFKVKPGTQAAGGTQGTQDTHGTPKTQEAPQRQQKHPRINMAFYGDNLDYLKEAAWRAKKSVTEYVNNLVAEDRKKNEGK